MARWCVGDPAARRPDHVALLVAHGVDRDGHLDADRWTYAQVDTAVRACAARLTGFGLQRGDRVLVRTGNRAAFPIAFFGAMSAGLVAVPVSDQLTADEAAFVLADSGAAAVVHDPALPLAVPEQVPVLPADAVDGALPTHDDLPDHVATDPDEPAFLTYTSGTTGRPKGVLHAHRSAWGRRPMHRGWYGLGPQDVVLHAGALSWTYTLGVGLTDPWALGATAVVYDGPRDRLVWPRLIAAAGATLFAAVPGVYRHLLRECGPAVWTSLPTLRHGLVAGEALPPAVLEAWTDATGRSLYEAFGMSEISTFVSAGPETPVRPGSPGRPQPGRRVAVLDAEALEQGREVELPQGSVGRLAVDRTDPGLMLGYWQRPQESAEALRGNWFVSGDLAAFDDDGYLHHHGRADDVMTAMGYRVAPAEVEQALADVPGLAEVAVAAVPIGDDGVSLITAFVVPQAPGSLDPGTFLEHARARLAPYKQPREVVLVDALPRTGNGKIRRRALVADRQTGDRSSG